MPCTEGRFASCLIKLTIMEIRAVGRLEMCWVQFAPLIDVGLTDLAKHRKGQCPSGPLGSDSPENLHAMPSIGLAAIECRCIGNGSK